jgi:hypothetical protein
MVGKSANRGQGFELNGTYVAPAPPVGKAINLELESARLSGLLANKYQRQALYFQP